MTSYSIQQHLELFRVNFDYHVNVNVEKDYMVYNVGGGKAEGFLRDAMNLIELLQLPLIAINSNPLKGNRVLIREKK